MTQVLIMKHFNHSKHTLSILLSAAAVSAIAFSIPAFANESGTAKSSEKAIEIAVTTMPEKYSETTTFTTCTDIHPTELTYYIEGSEVSIGGGGDMPWSIVVNGDLEIPASYQGLPVTKITDWSFEFNSTIDNVLLPLTIQSIGNHAFERCSLTSINLPNGLTHIGEYALSKCYHLKYVELPRTITSIVANAFEDTELEGCAFLNPDCDIPEYMDFPENMTVYGYAGSTAQAFAEKTGRPFVEISTDDITEPDTTAIATDAQGRLVDENGEVIIVNGTSAVMSGPETTTTTTTTTGPSNELSYYVNDGTVSISGGGDLPGAISVNGDLSIPAYYQGLPVTEILAWSFEFNSSINSVFLPSTIQTIGNNAFERCTLSYINLPEGLTSIGEKAFSKCSRLKSIEIPSTVASIPTSTFSETDLESCTFLNPDCEISEWTEFPQEMTVYGYAGSTAEAFAEKTGRPFVALSPAETIVTTTMFTTTTESAAGTTEMTETTTTTTFTTTVTDENTETGTLPQTGILSAKNWMIGTFAFLLTLGGAVMVWFSDILKRKENEN